MGNKGKRGNGGGEKGGMDIGKRGRGRMGEDGVRGSRLETGRRCDEKRGKQK